MHLFENPDRYTIAEKSYKLKGTTKSILIVAVMHACRHHKMCLFKLVSGTFDNFEEDKMF